MKIMKKLMLYTALLFLTIAFYQCKDDDDGGPTVFSDDEGNSIQIIEIDPVSPASLEFEEFVVITFEYNITHSEGARMWVQPYTEGDTSPGFLYSSSKVYSGSATRQVGISVQDGGDGPVNVDQLRVSMVNPDHSIRLIEDFINVNYNFGN